jgi:hypothetical protein
MFLSALILGRAWCGWGCPAGGLQEAASAVNSGPFKTGKRDWIKWFIGVIVAAAVSAGGYGGISRWGRVSLRAPFAKQSRAHEGDCFAEGAAPRNDGPKNETHPAAIDGWTFST